jgi:hypothetical protein
MVTDTTANRHTSGDVVVVLGTCRSTDLVGQRVIVLDVDGELTLIRPETDPEVWLYARHLRSTGDAVEMPKRFAGRSTTFGADIAKYRAKRDGDTNLEAHASPRQTRTFTGPGTS